MIYPYLFQPKESKYIGIYGIVASITPGLLYVDTYLGTSGGNVRKIVENYQRITDDRRSFDIRFWQSQGDRAIFEAVYDLLRDYFLIRGKNADEFRIQRTVESFRKFREPEKLNSLENE